MKEGGDCTESSTATTTSSGALRETTKTEWHRRHLEDSGVSQTVQPNGESVGRRPRSVFHDLEKETDEDEEEFVDSSSEDENADLKSIHYFNQHKAQSIGSLRRVDSLERFTTRSLRLSILGKDKPPPAEEAAKRTVRFRPDEDLESVLVLPEEEDNNDNSHMTHADFERNDADMKLTHIRWENHLNGKIRFNETECTVRGLEFLINRPEQLIRERLILRHRMEVLEVSLMQKTANLFQDHPLTRAPHQWEALRQASLEMSHVSQSEAQAKARQDHIDYSMAWGDSHDSVQHEKSLDNTFGINAAAAALLRGKHEQPKQRQQKSHSIKPQQQAQDKTKKKNPLLFWKKT
jgi:hypothetical protein